MKIGYVRTSKKDQNPDPQRRELEAFGCEKILEEQISSRKEDRPLLRAALDYCREGGALVVWKLDRLGRSLKELVELVNGLKDRGVEFVSLRENLDTTTPGGKLVFHVFASVAEFERDLIRKRTMVGLEAARARGRKGGRKRAMDEKKVALASKLLKDRETLVSEVCEAVGVSRATLYRYLKPDGTRRESGSGDRQGAVREGEA
jgi:DNA invertase Pin-like site-specific DNA recombinase